MSTSWDIGTRRPKRKKQEEKEMRQLTPITLDCIAAMYICISYNDFTVGDHELQIEI